MRFARWLLAGFVLGVLAAYLAELLRGHHASAVAPDPHAEEA